jgi:putative SOS response-associated peptidase YedK
MTASAARQSSETPDDEIVAERGRLVMVMRRQPKGGVMVPGYLTWGLIPHDADTRPAIQPTNARAETIAELPMFREAYRKRRCLVPIDAFHQKDAHGKRYTIKRIDGEPLAIAAIWENWKNPDSGKWERTFASVTVAANLTLAGVHDRMPLILEKPDFARWLGPEEDPRDLLTPSADDVLLVSSVHGKRPRRS